MLTPTQTLPSSPDLSAVSPYYKWYRDRLKDYDENLLLRRELIEFGSLCPRNARELWLACRRDILFYINAFIFLFEARPKFGQMPRPIPFITWDYQNETILDVHSAIRNGQDRLIEKSRDMGATWLCLAVLEHYWHFYDWMSAMITSRVDDLVDQTDEPDSLFWKIDFMHRWQPVWLLPEGRDLGRDDPCRTKKHLKNADNESVIDGESTTSNAGRGGRRAVILLDEFAMVPNGAEMLASTADNTNCRVFNSTHKGAENPFNRLKKTGIKVIRLHWSRHPHKNQGLYTSTSDAQPVLQILDKAHQFPRNYKFILDGKIRSPWYDTECLRREPWEVAQELDCDAIGTSFGFFNEIQLTRIIALTAIDPCFEGEVDIIEDGNALTMKTPYPVAEGRLLLWTRLDAHGNPPSEDVYVAAADVSAGTGASDSVLVIWSKKTREKVLEFVDRHLSPDEFAAYAVALCRWFNNAFLIWEAHGPGLNFYRHVQRFGYVNLYMRRNENKAYGAPTDMPGFHWSEDTKNAVLGDYKSALFRDIIVNRSKKALHECRQYVHNPEGAVVHSASVTSPDPTDKKGNHGDRVIADALAFRLLGWKPSSVAQAKQEAMHTQNCFAFRREAWKQKLVAASGWGNG